MLFNFKKCALSITLTTVHLFLISCNSIDSKDERTPEDIVADSLQAVADSIALTRQMHSMQIGYHQHSNANMAAIQHQPEQGKKKIRFKKRQLKTDSTETLVKDSAN